jgi:hypothetical protein
MASEKTSSPFSITSRPTKPNAGTSSPCHVPLPGVEDVAIYPAGPDADIIVHALLAQQLGHGFRRRDDRVAAAVEAPQYRFDNRLHEGEAVIARIGFEARVHRCDDGETVIPRPAQAAMAERIGARQMDEIRTKMQEITPDAAGHAIRHAIFLAAGHRKGGRADEVARRREGGRVRGRRIDAHGGALTQQIAHEAVERLVRAVAHIIVIAAEKGDAQAGDIHQRALNAGARKTQGTALQIAHLSNRGSHRPARLVP